MPKFLVKCNYEKLLTAKIELELPEDETDLAEFMEELENDGEIEWTEVKTVSTFTGYEV